MTALDESGCLLKAADDDCPDLVLIRRADATGAGVFVALIVGAAALTDPTALNVLVEPSGRGRIQQVAGLV
jgi:hypothetical protein